MAKKDEDLSQYLDLNKFQDKGGVTVKRLNFGLWVVSHRKYFIIGTIIFLIGFSAVFYGYTIYSYIDYYFISGEKERQNLEQLLNIPIVSEDQRLKSGALKLVDYPPQFFMSNQKYDLLGKVTNPNSTIYVTISYCFNDAGAELACSTALLFPGETKYLSILGVDLSNRPANLTFVIKDTAWQRLNAHVYPNWDDFYKTHLNFSVSQVQFKSAAASGLSEKLNLDSLEFSLTNNSAFNYWEVPFDIVYFEGNNVVGVNATTIANFLSGETRAVKLTWADSLTHISDIKVLPAINIMDDSVYKKY
jgi:hypothetical protein